MILTKEQIEKRLSSEDNISNKLELHKLNSAREDGTEKILTGEANESNEGMQGILSSEQLENEVIYRDGKNHFGRPGAKNLSEQEKLAIGVLSNTVGKEVAAELMGVTENTARHLKTAQETLSHGRGTQRTVENTKLKEAIEERLNKAKLSIQERAAEKLLKSMGLLSDEKLENCNAKDLAQISNQMSSVVRNMTNSNNSNSDKKTAVRIIVQQPNTVKESSFDVLEIGVSS